MKPAAAIGLLVVLGALPLALIAASTTARPLPESAEVARAADASFARGMSSEGNSADRRRHFEAAADGYEALRRTVDLAATSYNLGNARLEAGQPAAAIAAYRRALLIDPSGADARSNLDEARRRLVKPTPPPPPELLLERLRGAWNIVPGPSRAIAAVVLWSLAFCVFIRRIAGAGWASRASMPAAVAAACALVLAATVLLDDLAIRWSDRAVVAAGTVARRGNGEGFEAAFSEPVPAGTECRMREARPGWIEVEFGDGGRAWLPEASVLRVVDPAS